MPASLRSRQQELARDAIVAVAAEALHDGDPDALSLSDVAARAGVSDRTLYRYFSSRDELMAAAAQHLVASLDLAPPVDADDVPGWFLTTSGRMAEHPRLVRNLVRTRAGGYARSRHREGRAREIVDVVRAQAPAGAPAGPTEAAGAVIALLCSATAWSTVRDEAGISADGARAGVAWAIDVLLGCVRRSELPSAAAPTKARRSPTTGRRSP